MSELLTIRHTCRLCGSPRIDCSVPLAQVPIVSPNVETEKNGRAGKLTQIVAPLDTYICQDCGLIQLIHVVNPELIYRNYLYRTQISLGLAEHFRSLSEAVIGRLGLNPSALVVEFGSNDGTLLAHFHAAGMRVQGVDPAKGIAAEATAKGIPTRADFFGPALAGDLRATIGPAAVVIANNAMANIDDLTAILNGVKALLAPEGAFVFETQYALDVFEKFLLDVIYHEHISTFSVQPVAMAFKRHGLEVFDAERIPTKGGSIRFWVQHSDGPRPIAARVDELIKLERETGLYDLAYHRKFGEHVIKNKHELHDIIDAARGRGKSIAGYGTSVGCAALIHQFELEGRLDYLLDDAPFKNCLEGPGYDLKVYKADRLIELSPGLVVVLAWRYTNPIVAKNSIFIKNGGSFVVPLPNVHFQNQTK